MIVVGYSHRGKLNIRRVNPKIKINSKVYQEDILEPIYTKDIPNIYGNDKNKVFVHMDKASSHTSKSTVNYLKMKQIETGISFIPFSDIPTKSPDLSPMDFCGFGLLKQALRTRKPTTLDGLWKTCQQCWQEIPMDTLQKSLLSWKYRCRLVVESQGFHIENKLH